MRPQLPAGIGSLGAVMVALAVARPLGLAVGAPVDPVDPATGPTTPSPTSTAPASPPAPTSTGPSPSTPPASGPSPSSPPASGPSPSPGPPPSAPQSAPPATRPAPPAAAPDPPSPPAQAAGAGADQTAPSAPTVTGSTAVAALQAVPIPSSTSDLWLTQIAAALGPGRLSYGARITVTGFVPSRQQGVPLTLQFRQRRGRWRSLAAGRSGPGGTYRFVVPAVRSGAVRVIVTGSDGNRRMGAGSAAHAVLIEPVLRVRGVRGSILRTRRATVTGRLRGAGSKRLVILQRRARGRWRTVARSRTVGDGMFRLRYLPRAPGRGALRVRFPGDSDLAAAQALIGWRGRGGLLGAAGRVIVRRGANAAGRPMTRRMMRFISLMSRVFGAPLVVTTGTNHSTWTTTGGISDHVSGNAADFGVWANHGAGDRIAAAALVVAGLSPAEAIARARRGGLINVVRHGIRVQVIWKTWLGGNHFSHVHVGVRPRR